MVIHQSNKVWNVNGTYTLQDIANQHIKPQQQIHLQLRKHQMHQEQYQLVVV